MFKSMLRNNLRNPRRPSPSAAAASRRRLLEISLVGDRIGRPTVKSVTSFALNNCGATTSPVKTVPHGGLIQDITHGRPKFIKAQAAASVGLTGLSLDFVKKRELDYPSQRQGKRGVCVRHLLCICSVVLIYLDLR